MRFSWDKNGSDYLKRMLCWIKGSSFQDHHVMRYVRLQKKSYHTEDGPKGIYNCKVANILHT